MARSPQLGKQGAALGNGLGLLPVGRESGGSASASAIGDIVASETAPTDGTWLRADGDGIRESDYPELVAKLESKTAVWDRLDTPTGITATNKGWACAYSPDGKYMVAGFQAAPYINIFSRGGNEFTKLADPSTMPTGNGYGAAFSPDSSYLAVAHSGAGGPYLTIYSISGDGVFTKLANPSTLPTGDGWGAAYSPDGGHLAIAHNTSPYLTIYSVSGDTYTKLANPSTLPTGLGRGAAYSPDGNFLAIAHNTSPYVTIYSISGDTYTKLANPSTLPTGIGFSAVFSPDSSYLVVGHQSSPYITMYSISGSTFTKVANPSSLPGGTADGLAYSPDGKYLAMGVANTTIKALMYSQSGSVLTNISAFEITDTNATAKSCAFSAQGGHLSFAIQQSPWVANFTGQYDVDSRLLPDLVTERITYVTPSIPRIKAL